MSKKWWVILIIVLMSSGIYYKYTHPSEDTRTHMEKEIVLNEVPFKISVAYENEYLEHFKATPDDRYRCTIEYEIEIDNDETFDKEFRIISNLNPISIDNIYLREFYQDNKIIIYGSDLKYNANGDFNDEILLYNIELYVYLKLENKYFSFEDWEYEFVPKIKSYGYEEYDLDKTIEIRKENLPKLKEENNLIKKK